MPYTKGLRETNCKSHHHSCHDVGSVFHCRFDAGRSAGVRCQGTHRFADRLNQWSGGIGHGDHRVKGKGASRREFDLVGDEHPDPRDTGRRHDYFGVG